MVHQAIYILVVYGAFYLTLFGFLPAVGLFLLGYFLNRRYGFETVNLKQHLRLIIGNAIVVVLAILIGVLCYIIKQN